jgi:hypothetical protein
MNDKCKGCSNLFIEVIKNYKDYKDVKEEFTLICCDVFGSHTSEGYIRGSDSCPCNSCILKTICSDSCEILEDHFRTFRKPIKLIKERQGDDTVCCVMDA